MAARLLMIGLACVVILGCEGEGTDPPRDSQAPGAVIDLAVVAWSPSRTELRWTAPGDDGKGGGAVTAYDVRYASLPIASDAEWDAATPLEAPAPPQTPGMVESREPSDLPAGRPLYFALRAVDDAGNWSAVSNSAALDSYLAPITIANQLVNLITSYEERNADAYTALLDPDFLFVFSPADVGGGVPESWERADEAVSARRMLGGEANSDGYRAESVSLTFMAQDPVPSDRDPGWMKVMLASVNLRVESVHPDHGTLIYLVQGDRADIHFLETDDIHPQTGERIWRIVYWKDLPIGLRAPSTESTSWGAVKASWH